MFLWLSWGFTTTQNSICTASDLDRARLTDTQSAENDWIEADTDHEHRIEREREKERTNEFMHPRARDRVIVKHCEQVSV